MRYVGPAKLRELLPQLDSKVFSPKVFDQTGVFVIRQAVPEQTMRVWQAEWENFYRSTLEKGRAVNKFNPVAVDETPPPILAAIHKEPALLDIIEQAFGPDIALYNQRFVIKYHNSRDKVFLHQDFPYHLGWPTKASAFVAISEVTPQNGGLNFYVGTHQFGYLGDVGEINPSVIDADWPSICPSLKPGDVALMNSSTWHMSGPHTGGPDRVIADIIYQPASDPSGVALLRGQWQTELFSSKIPRNDIFVRCRSSRLREMQQKLDAFEAEKQSVS